MIMKLKTVYTQEEMKELYSLFEQVTDQCIQDLETKLAICKDALLFYANTLDDNQVAKQSLDQIDKMEACPIHNINYKDCEC